MEPEELDVVELLEDVSVEPAWRVKSDTALDRLSGGTRGMVVHRYEETPPRFDVEFVDAETHEPYILATLRGDKLRVVERDTLAIE